MTDNAEREAFKKILPCHPDVYWHETMKRWVTNGAYLLEAHAYNCQWEGFQARSAVARAELSAVKAERDAVIEECAKHIENRDKAFGNTFADEIRELLTKEKP